MEKHQYIELLEYAMSQKGSYHMEPGLVKAKMTESEFQNVRDAFFVNAHIQAPPPNKSQVFNWRLSPEAVFGYLSYKQYEHAQKSSTQAFYISIASLSVAVLTLAVTVASIWL